jgi:NAD(P)-dependent dehydrogenase (short-subunit alcohol dehydrogenase family)
MCVISSIWQSVARRDKLSYMMTKAALQGLVMSVAIDLAERGILINAVLPGALDTPMTHRSLTPSQISAVATATPFRRLASLEDVGHLTAFLTSPLNTSITGQFVAVDLGFANAKAV